MPAVATSGEGCQRRLGHRRGLDRLLVVRGFRFAPRIPIEVADGPEAIVDGRLGNKEAKGLFGDRQERPFRPELSSSKQAVREDGVGIRHPRFKPRPIGAVGPGESHREPQRCLMRHRLQRPRFADVGLVEMRPGEDHVGLGPQAADLGERRQNGLDQFPGNGPVALGEPTAEDLGQR